MSGCSDGLAPGHVWVGSPRLQYLAADGVILELDVAPRNVELGTGGPYVVPVSGAQGEPVRMPHQREPAAEAVPGTDYELALIHCFSVAPASADRPGVLWSAACADATWHHRSIPTTGAAGHPRRKPKRQE